jgi:hypothetical protein
VPGTEYRECSVRLQPDRSRQQKESNVKPTNDDEKEQPGDVLGVSNPAGPKLPHPPSDGSTPRGIEVRGEPTRHWGNEEMPQSDGASGIDMGGAGEGTGIKASRPRAAAKDEDRDLGGSSE